jgi:spore germination protein GerM
MTDQPPRNRRLIPVLGLSAAMLMAACAMPTDAEPSALVLDEEYAELLEPAPPTTATSTTALEATREVRLWFIEDDLLRPQSEQLPVSRARSLTAVLNELIGGTRQENHRTAIPSGVEVIDTRIDEDRRIATIVLADSTLFSVEATDRLRAIAQFVFTATDRGLFGIDGVRFEIDGNIRSIPTGSGSDTSDPVGRCDYSRFWPESIGCPTTTTTTTSPAGNNSDTGG